MAKPDAWNHRHYERMASDPIYAARYTRRQKRIRRECSRAMRKNVELMEKIVQGRLAAGQSARDRLVAALNRGELMMLLADVEARRLAPADLVDAMTERGRRRPWWERLALWLVA